MSQKPYLSYPKKKSKKKKKLPKCKTLAPFSDPMQLI